MNEKIVYSVETFWNLNDLSNGLINKINNNKKIHAMAESVGESGF